MTANVTMFDRDRTLNAVTSVSHIMRGFRATPFLISNPYIYYNVETSHEKMNCM